MWYDKLTDKELAAIRVLVKRLCEHEREDTIGCILKTGAFRLLDDGDTAVVRLAQVLEGREDAG